MCATKNGGCSLPCLDSQMLVCGQDQMDDGVSLGRGLLSPRVWYSFKVVGKMARV